MPPSEDTREGSYKRKDGREIQEEETEAEKGRRRGWRGDKSCLLCSQRICQVDIYVDWSRVQ